MTSRPLAHLRQAHQDMLDNHFDRSLFKRLTFDQQSILTEAAVQLDHQEWLKALVLNDFSWLTPAVTEHLARVGFDMEEIAQTFQHPSIDPHTHLNAWYDILKSAQGRLGHTYHEFLDSKLLHDHLAPTSQGQVSPQDQQWIMKTLRTICSDCMTKGDERVRTFFSWLMAWDPLPLVPPSSQEEEEDLFFYLEEDDDFQSNSLDTVFTLLTSMNNSARQHPNMMQTPEWVGFYQHLLGFCGLSHPQKDYPHMHKLLVQYEEKTQLLDATGEKGSNPRRAPKVM